ncbi:MAG TPA: hypothetical protein VNZ22_16890, partial [Bacillota bacterium]|nr:hypothetical protein [Bacillota bacterium]
MQIAGEGQAWLQFNWVEEDSHTNILFPEGALSFWLRPVAWSSTNIEGGTGPRVPARLLEIGAYSAQGHCEWLSL